MAREREGEGNVGDDKGNECGKIEEEKQRGKHWKAQTGKRVEGIRGWKEKEWVGPKRENTETDGLR